MFFVLNLTAPVDMRIRARTSILRSFSLICFAVCASCVSWGQDAEDECEGLSPDKEALCRLLATCKEIQEGETRQKCFELAIDPSPDSHMQPVAEDPTSRPAEDAAASIDDAPPVQEELAEPEKKKGFFRRLGGTLRNVVRRDRQTEAMPDSEPAADDPDNGEWREGVVAKTGRIDRAVFLVVLDDGNLYRYSAPPQKRLRIGQNVSVQHIKTWATDSYRITPHHGGTFLANRIRCERKYLVGTPKKHCEMMLDIDPDHWER